MSKKPKLSLLVFDFDGVLTDNKVLVLEDGREAVFCNRADGLAFDALRRVGFPTLIMSTETNPVVRARAKKLKVEALQAIADKGTTIREYCAANGTDPRTVAFVGNDVNDLPAFKVVGYPIAVADAHPLVKKSAWKVLKTRGGQGVAREIVETILRIPIH
jgi:3-deoxy-D-manno-octulosonate 8-phosphate phosphatase (KDO 8-P phosphatase)